MNFAPKVMMIILLLIPFFVVGIFMAIGWFLSPQNDLKKSDAIVAVSGGDTKRRALQAVKLYREGWADEIIFSGAAFDPNSPSNAAEMREIAIKQGVPTGAIWLDEVSDNTVENARNVRDIIKSQNIESIILVTSPYHQRRTNVVFSKVIKDIEIINHSAIDTEWRRSLWWTSGDGWFFTMDELPKVIFTYLVDSDN